MQVTHQVYEKSGMLGGKSFFAKVRVDLDPAEKAIIDAFQVVSRLHLGERYADHKPMDSIGGLSLGALLSGVEIKFEHLNVASDFVAVVLEQLQHAKAQIEGTRENADMLGKEFVTDVS